MFPGIAGRVVSPDLKENTTPKIGPTTLELIMWLLCGGKKHSGPTQGIICYQGDSKFRFDFRD
jgi:hypothetical protein